MDIERLFNDRKYLENEIIFFIRKKHIRSISKNKELVISHLKKAKHNFEFYKLNKKYSKFNDWLIVTLYYVLYHSALALITNKEFSSKNHDDAEFYTQLKEDRHEASYTTNIKFNQEIINDYEDKVLDFINKTEELISL